MLALIASTALPLFFPAKASPAGVAPGAAESTVKNGPLAVLADDDRLAVWSLLADGTAELRDVKSGKLLEKKSLRPDGAGRKIVACEAAGAQDFSLLWDDGAAAALKVEFKPAAAAAGAKTVTCGVRTLWRVQRPEGVTAPEAPPAATACPMVALRPGEEGGGTQVWHLAAGNFLVVREKTETDPMGEEKTTRAAFTAEPGETVSAWTLSRDGGTLYAGSATGALMRWDLSADKAVLLDHTRVFGDGRSVTALGLVFGDVSLAVGDSMGGVTIWSPASIYGPDGGKHLAQTHMLAPHKSPVRRFFFTQHDKGVLSLSEDGVLHVNHMTSERLMLELAGISTAAAPALSARGDSLCALGADGRLTLWSVRNPHPEVGAKVLFGKVWYENYDRPELVWQSSSSNDDAEAKLSLIPLIFGSLKATFYALLLAIPLALAGALYTSQFAPPEVKAVVKPAVEIMAAVPSVVIGFIAALWLAPKLEAGILSVAAFAVVLPLVFILFMAVWMRLVRPTPFGRRIDKGWEFAVVVPVLLGAAALAWWLGPLAERLLFAGDFKLWLFREAGWRVDQRNSIVIAFALGFAVIPVLFTIAEDAFSNVPKSLKAASLALGASRWQTVWRVVLPGASPGVFAAIIIGFGRAVGETMIVLMATGNTPVLDWGPFSGMRTLSANIAVEVPEAAAGGTLYRVLFLSAVLLFVLTSVLNTAAEVIRHKLRKRYAE
jgi:phosphate transport system permease protein